MRNLVQLINRHLGRLQSVKEVHVSKGNDATQVVVWIVCWYADVRIVRAVRARQDTIAAARHDLKLDFRLYWKEFEDMPSRRQFKAAKPQRVYRRR